MAHSQRNLNFAPIDRSGELPNNGMKAVDDGVPSECGSFSAPAIATAPARRRVGYVTSAVLAIAGLLVTAILNGHLLAAALLVVAVALAGVVTCCLYALDNTPAGW